MFFELPDIFKSKFSVRCWDPSGDQHRRVATGALCLRGAGQPPRGGASESRQLAGMQDLGMGGGDPMGVATRQTVKASVY